MTTDIVAYPAGLGTIVNFPAWVITGMYVVDPTRLPLPRVRARMPIRAKKAPRTKIVSLRFMLSNRHRGWPIWYESWHGHYLLSSGIGGDSGGLGNRGGSRLSVEK